MISRYRFRFLVLTLSAPLLCLGFLSTQASAQVSAPSPSTPNQQIDLQNLTPPEQNVPNELTLDDAIKAALTRNYTVQTGQNQQRRAEIEVTRAHDAFLPSASASGSYNYNYSLAPLSERTTTVTDLSGAPTREIIVPAGSHGLSYSAGANFNIYNGGADAAHVRSANDQLGAAKDNLVWTRQEIAFNVTSDYINALRMNELVNSAAKTLAESKAELERIKGLYQAGSIPIGQVYQQEAVVGQNEVARIQAQNNYENAKADVLFLLNVSPNDYANYRMTTNGIDTSTSETRRLAIDTSISAGRIDAVIQNRPDINAAQLQIQNIQDQIAMTRAALLPRLDATAGIGGGGDNSDLMKTHIQNHLSAGLSLSVPIFDRNQNRLLIDEQEIDIETQRVQLQQQVQQIRSDAAKAVNNLRSADQALSASQRALVSAEESLRLATERLRVGAGTQVDVIVAEAAVVTARTNQVNAKFNYVLAQRQLEFTLGQWNY